jgi:hypothetical protein
VTQDRATCWSLGDPNVYAWDVTPSGAGVMLQMYHGSPINDITRAQSIIYIMCGRDAAPFFEHERICFDSTSGNNIGAQYHFQIKTKLAC